jgi:hypothetical protein
MSHKQAMMGFLKIMMDHRPDDEMVIGTAPSRHFLDVADDRSRPTVKRLVREILDHHKWTIYTLSTRTGIQRTVLYGVINGTQEGLYPVNQKRLMTAVSGVPALVSLYRQTDWGKAQTRRTR